MSGQARGGALDEELFDSIRRRQASGGAEADLLGEMDSLVAETNKRLEASAREEEEGAGKAASRGAAQGGGSGALRQELARMMAVLQQKEADLELAARIGDALFQENTRLRKEQQQRRQRDGGSGGDKHDGADEQLVGAREEIKTLQRKLDLVSRHLADADAANASLSEQLETAQAAAQTSWGAASPPGSPPSQRARGSQPASVSKAELDAVGGEGGGSEPGRGLCGARKGHDEELRAALEAARRLGAASEQRLDAAARESSELRSALTDAEQRGARLQGQLAAAQQSLRDAARDGAALREALASQRGACDALEKDNARLRDDLDEHGALLRGSSSPSAAERSRSLRRGDSSRDADDGDSLAAELAAALQQPPPPAPEPAPVPAPAPAAPPALPAVVAPAPAPALAPAPRVDDVDPYFFHFHMTAMSVKAHLSLSGQSTRREGGRTVISNAALDTINALDTKQMYAEVMDKSIPPHHWIGFIKDSFARAHLQALVNSKAGAAEKLASQRLLASSGLDADDAFGGSQSYLVEPASPQLAGGTSSRRSSAASAATSTPRRPANKSYFARLLSSMTTASPQPDDSASAPQMGRAVTPPGATAPAPAPSASEAKRQEQHRQEEQARRRSAAGAQDEHVV